MTKYDEYCYNLMETAIQSGAEHHGVKQEVCVALMNMISGARGAEKYINDKKEAEQAQEVVPEGAT